MTKRIWLILLAAGIVAVGIALILAPHWWVKTNKTVVTLGGLPPISYPGFQLWPTPRTFDQPGTAFIKKGERVEHVADLDLKNERVGVESLVGAKTSGTWNGGLLAQFLGVTKLSVNSSQDIVVKVELSEGERWRIDRQALDRAIRNVKWPTEDEGTPYVVTEAISVNAIKYEVTLSGDTGGSLDTSGFGNTAIGTLTAQKKDDGSYVLNQVFSEPHYLFYLASQIRRHEGRAAGVTAIPENNQLRWTTEVISGSTKK
jgi:hypothetical protein